jgi:hypothetical protein
MNRLNRILLDPTGAGEGNNTPTPTPSPTPKEDDFDVQAAVQQLLAKHGNAERALGYLLRDNQGYRKKNAELKAKVPDDKAVVLAGDDAKAWDEYRALGKAGDLKEALAERDRFRDEASGLRRAEVHKQAAEVHGYKASVLSDLIERDRLPIEVREEKVGTKTARVAYVKHADDKGKEVETRLPDYAEKHWLDYLPSLAHTAAPPPGTPRRGTTSGPPPAPAGKVPELYEGRNPFS